MKYLQMTKLVGQETKISNALLNDNTKHDDNTTSSPAPVKTPPSQSKIKSYKIIVLGESGVGKTCLSFRWQPIRFENINDWPIRTKLFLHSDSVQEDFHYIQKQP